MTFTAILPVTGFGNGLLLVLYRDAHAASSMSARTSAPW